LDRPGFEDSSECIELGELLKQVSDGRDVVYSGTDYGIVTLATTVAISTERLNAHIELFNYYHVLDNHELVDDDAGDLKAIAASAALAVPKKEVCHRTTAGQIQQMSLGRKFARRRERRKVCVLCCCLAFSNAKLTDLFQKQHPEVMAAEGRLAKNSFSLAQTASDVLRLHKVGIPNHMDFQAQR
jgi:hypothetical protein